MAAWKTCCSLVVDPALSRSTVKVVFGLGGPCTALTPGLRSGGLESQFGWGPGHPGPEGDGLVLLMPWVQAGHVFLGTQLGALIHESSGDLVRLVYGLAS